MKVYEQKVFFALVIFAVWMNLIFFEMKKQQYEDQISIQNLKNENIDRRRERIELLSIMEMLAKDNNYYGIDIARMKLERSWQIDEVRELIKQEIASDNVEEDEYNSLVASTIMQIEDNMRIIGQVKEIEKELLKKEILNELTNPKDGL